MLMGKNMKKTSKLDKKLKGFHRHFRGRFLLLKDKTLTDSEYVLWDLCVSVLSGWDFNKYPEDYGVFDFSLTDIKYFVGWSESKISRNINSLIKKGFLTKDHEVGFRISGYAIFKYLYPLTKQFGVVDLKKFLSFSENTISLLESLDAKEQEILFKEIDNFQDESVSNLQTADKNSLGSYKDNLISSNFNKDKYINSNNTDKYKEFIDFGNKLLEEKKGGGDM